MMKLRRAFGDKQRAARKDEKRSVDVVSKDAVTLEEGVQEPVDEVE